MYTVCILLLCNVVIWCWEMWPIYFRVAPLAQNPWGNHIVAFRSQYTKLSAYLMGICCIWLGDHYGYGLSQWENALLSNACSHWLSPYPHMIPVTAPTAYNTPRDKLQMKQSQGWPLIFNVYIYTAINTHFPGYFLWQPSQIAINDRHVKTNTYHKAKCLLWRSEMVLITHLSICCNRDGLCGNKLTKLKLE